MKTLVLFSVLVVTLLQQANGQVKIGAGIKCKTNNNVFVVLKNISLVNNGTLVQTIGDGTVKFTGSKNTSIAGSGSTIFDKLVIANDSGFTNTLSSGVIINNVVTITSGQLASNGFLTLHSDSNYTARVAPITSTSVPAISGNVNVERYIPARRKYRLITSSVTSSTSTVLTAGQEALSIWGNWQNSGNNSVANSGTFITGGTAADGFDSQTGNASVYTYDDSLRRYIAFSSAKGKNTKYTPLKAGVAYFMFVYGDRKNSISTSNPNKTILHETGTLLTGDQTYTTTSAIPLSNVTNRFTLLGNPFASAIDWATVSKTNIAGTYWAWDPNLNNTGGYLTVNTIGDITLIAPFSGSTGLTQYIQPGQGFFVKTTGTSPQLIIREQDKSTVISNFAFRPNNNNNLPLLAINLMYTTNGQQLLADGALAAFNEAFSNEVAAEDAAKMEGSSETLSILQQGQLLSINARKLPVITDTLQLQLTRLTKAKYTLQIFANSFVNSNVQPYLYDNFLQTTIPLSINDTNSIAFTITSDSASFKSNRYKIIFQPYSILPITFNSIKATKKDKLVEVAWQVQTTEGIDRYQVERSENGVNFSLVNEVKARVNNGGATRYSWVDVNPVTGYNYYRVRSIGINGNATISKLVSVLFDAVRPTISVYPNPVKNHTINIQVNQLPAGTYHLMLYNPAGQKITDINLQHVAGNANYTMVTGANLPKGIYYLRLEGENVINTSKMIIVE